MASFLTRALALPPAEPAVFTDTVGNVHSASIDTLAAEGITLGCATHPALYCPDRPVTRAEMATLLARAVNLAPRAEIVEEVEPEIELERVGDLHLVSQFTTYHYCCSPRVTNIHLFADLVDGAVVKPGERFSLNRRVGQRTEEKGFVEAGTLVNGTVIPGVEGESARSPPPSTTRCSGADTRMCSTCLTASTFPLSRGNRSHGQLARHRRDLP